MYDAEKLFKSVYEQMNGYRKLCEERKTIYRDSFNDGKMVAIDMCIDILKSTHMIFDKDDAKMSEKVKLPREVCNALDFLRITKNNSCSEIVYRLYGKNVILPDVLLNQNSETIMRALVLGYEPEVTAEDILKGIYDAGYVANNEHTDAFRHGIKQTLIVHGIHYDWKYSE